MVRTRIHQGPAEAPEHHVHLEDARGRGTPSSVLLVPSGSSDALAAALKQLHDPDGPLDLDVRLGRLAAATPAGTGFLVAVDDAVWAFPGGPFEFQLKRSGEHETLSEPQMFRLEAGESCEVVSATGELVATMIAEAALAEATPRAAAAPPAREAARDPARAAKSGPDAKSSPAPAGVPPRWRPRAGTAALAVGLLGLFGWGIAEWNAQRGEPRADGHEAPDLDQRMVELLTRGAEGSRRSTDEPKDVALETAPSGDATAPDAGEAALAADVLAAVPAAGSGDEAAGAEAAADAGGPDGPGDLAEPRDEAHPASPDRDNAPGSVAPGPEWSFRAAAAITSSPRFVDGRVIFGSRDQHLYCLDAASGETLWALEAGSGIGSSPCVAGNLAYVGTYAGQVLAVRLDSGELAWRTTTGGKIVSSPAVVRGNVIVGSYDGHVHAFDAKDGTPRWAVPTGGAVRASPEPFGPQVVIGAADGRVWCLTAEAGRVTWRTQLQGTIHAQAAAVEGGRLIVGTRDGQIACLDGADGGVVWRASAESGINGRPRPAGDHVVIGTGRGQLLALALADGAPRWTLRADRGFDASPVLVGETLVAPSYDGIVHLVDAGSGGVRETRQLGAEVWSSPAVGDGRVFLGTMEGSFHALALP